VRLLVDSVEANLRRNGHERRGIRLGVGHAEGEIDGAGSERRGADPGLAGEAAVDVRHKRRALFMPRENEAYLGARCCIDKPDVLLARNAEHVLDAFRFEARDHQIRDGFLNDTVAHVRFLSTCLIE